MNIQVEKIKAELEFWHKILYGIVAKKPLYFQKQEELEAYSYTEGKLLFCEYMMSYIDSLSEDTDIEIVEDECEDY